MPIQMFLISLKLFLLCCILTFSALEVLVCVLFLCLFLDCLVGLHVETVMPEAGGQRKKNAPVAAPKPDEVHVKSAGGEPERSDSDDSLEPES